jgi:hypothetical protein
MSSTPSRLPAPLKKSLDHCLAQLEHGLVLASLCSAGTEPERAVEHLVGMLDDLGPELRQLRTWTKSPPA